MAQPAQITTTSVRITLLVKKSSPTTALSNDIVLYSSTVLYIAKDWQGLEWNDSPVERKIKERKKGGGKGKKNHV